MQRQHHAADRISCDLISVASLPKLAFAVASMQALTLVLTSMGFGSASIEGVGHIAAKGAAALCRRDQPGRRRRHAVASTAGCSCALRP